MSRGGSLRRTISLNNSTISPRWSCRRSAGGQFGGDELAPSPHDAFTEDACVPVVVRKVLIFDTMSRP
jgi:hypothetical protein